MNEYRIVEQHYKNFHNQITKMFYAECRSGNKEKDWYRLRSMGFDTYEDALHQVDQHKIHSIIETEKIIHNI